MIFNMLAIWAMATKQKETSYKKEMLTAASCCVVSSTTCPHSRR
jgi:hypothetical protein